MDFQPPSTAPDAGSVLRFVALLLWKSKWLIAAAAAIAAVLAFALTTSNKTEIWSGRTILTIGLAPAGDFLTRKSGPAITLIESPRRTVARLSDPSFKSQIINRATFDPATASISRSMVPSSLRGVVLDGDREIAVELSAGSAADVQAAFRAIGAELAETHGRILDRQTQLLQSRIDSNKERIAAIEKEVRELNDRILQASPSNRRDPRRLPASPMPATTMAAWNELQVMISNDMILKQLSEPSVLRAEAGNLVVTHRSLDRLQASLLAGAGMLVAMIILTIAVSPPRHPPVS